MYKFKEEAFRPFNNQQCRKTVFLNKEINQSCQLLKPKCVRISLDVEALLALLQGRLVGVDEV